MKFLIGVLVVCAVFGLTACGGGESPTSSQETTAGAAEAARLEALRLEKEKAEAEAAKAEAQSQKRQATRAARAAQMAAQASQAPDPEPEEVPDVVGMRLPQAETTLRAAGYKTNAENTDTTFGILVPSHYTVCEQDEPQGSLVTVLAQKYGC